jgi:hypothetical protein
VLAQCHLRLHPFAPSHNNVFNIKNWQFESILFASHDDADVELRTDVYST